MNTLNIARSDTTDGVSNDVGANNDRTKRGGSLIDMFDFKTSRLYYKFSKEYFLKCPGTANSYSRKKDQRAGRRIGFCEHGTRVFQGEI